MRLRTYDPLFTQFPRFNAVPSAVRPNVPLDVVRHEDSVELHFDLPGVDVDSIDLTVEKRELVLRAERKFAPADDADLIRSERRHGAFERRLVLAENLDSEALEAECTDGVLRVRIGVIAAAEPRRIAIGTRPDELAA